MLATPRFASLRIAQVLWCSHDHSVLYCCMAIYANEPHLDTLLLLNPVKRTLQTTIMSSVNYTEIMIS